PRPDITPLSLHDALPISFWQACPFKPTEYNKVTTQLIRTDSKDPRSNEEAVAVWKLSLFDSEPKKLGRAVFQAVSELSLASIPGDRKSTRLNSSHVKIAY